MKYLTGVAFATLLFVSCAGDNEPVVKDMEKPAIIDGTMPSPINCEVYSKGGVIPFRYTFTDNVELGNFNIEIHNNFDHHSHSTSAGSCEFEEKKKPVNAWVYNKDFSISAGSKTYEAVVDIPVPTDIDTGDYHFMIRLTDRAGSQQLKAVSIKVKDAE